MSKTSAIQHPPKDRFVMIRASYLALCEGDHCAAAILHEAEHWYNYRLANSNQATQENERAQQNDETPSQVTDLWFYMTVEDWQSTALLGAFSERKVQAALTWLVDNEYLFRRNNPKYAWDRTFQYLLNVVKVQECITSKCGNGSAQNEASNTTVHEQNTEEDSNTTPVAKNATGGTGASKNGETPSPLDEIYDKAAERQKDWCKECGAKPGEKHALGCSRRVNGETPHTAMKNAIVTAFGWQPEDVTVWGDIDKASKLLRQVSFPPEEVSALHQYCAGRFTEFGPVCLPKYVPDFRKGPAPSPIEDY